MLVFRFIRATPSDQLPPPRAWGPEGGGRVLKGQKGYTTKNQVLCQFWGFNSGDFKNDLYFHLIVHPTTARARAPPGGGLGVARGGFSPILPKIMCYIESKVFNIVGISKIISF